MSDANVRLRTAPLGKLEEIRQRDAASVPTWFKEPALGACGRAFIDRRVLLGHIDTLLLRLVRINAINDNPSRFDAEIDVLSTVADVDRPKVARLKPPAHG